MKRCSRRSRPYGRGCLWLEPTAVLSLRSRVVAMPWCPRRSGASRMALCSEVEEGLVVPRPPRGIVERRTWPAC
eukprot:10917329-Alexandrium_andersonii.AAC.1